jgi:hypothetical protein
VNQRLPFDTRLPSPIGRLAQLRAVASEAVVRDKHSSPVQHLMAPPGKLEEALWEALGGEDQPRLLVLTGSAGSGKSATLNHLLHREASTGAGRIGMHLADATHSDAPDQDQADKLAAFFEPFADDADEPAEPCRVIAMNTGMALRFFHDLKAKPAAPALAGLEALLLSRLGLPHSKPLTAQPWLDEAVLVVNLDARSTAGSPGALFDQILLRLDPANPEGVLEGAERCNTCQVQDWCWPMANAVAISSNTGRVALDAAVGDVAVTRGRHLSPRALWDTAAGLALGGLDLRLVDGRDPCLAIARAAEAGDETLLVQSLACNGAFGPPVTASPIVAEDEGSPIAELAARDPSYLPTLAAHELIADAGLDLAEDGKRFNDWLSGDGGPHPALIRAAKALTQGRATLADGSRVWGRVLARAAWLGGDLKAKSSLPDRFSQALEAQALGATEDDGTDDGRSLEDALSVIEEGLAAVFGLVSGPEHYYPTSTPRPGAAADLLVHVALIDDGWMKTLPDPVLHTNRRGALLVDYRPLALSISVADRQISVDCPLWLLLDGAIKGQSPSALDLERFLALRQAVRIVGVTAAAEPSRPLLVREHGQGGRRFRVITRNPAANVLRATEVR